MEHHAEILELEEELRNLNSELQGITPRGIDQETYQLSREGYYNIRTFRKLIETLDDAEDLLDDVYFEYDEVDAIRRASDTLIDWLSEIKKNVNVFCDRKYPHVICDEFPTWKFKKFQEKVRDEGITCGLIGEDEDEASFIRVVDSFTNCLHSLGLELAKLNELSSELASKTGGICIPVDTSPNEVLIEACEKFAEYVDENSGCYKSFDVGRQKGYVFRDKIQFEIGGQEGHRAEIDLREGVFRYYDEVDLRANTLAKVLSEAFGLECRGGGYNEYICTGVKEEHVPEIARLLAFIPSLDLYMRDYVEDYIERHLPECERECVESNTEYLESCRKSCERDCKSGNEFVVSYYGKDYNICVTKCTTECVESKCYHDCWEKEESKAEDIVSESVEKGLMDVVRNRIDDYCELLESVGIW
ncbi:MAG: hypothetical protein ACXQS2_03830 [Methermicoccaceae archaeon]